MPTRQDVDHPTKTDGWWIYLLVGEGARRSYIGIAVDVNRRLRQHNGEVPGGARSTRSGRPWSICRTLGPVPDRSIASRLEHWLKRARGSARKLRFENMAALLQPLVEDGIRRTETWNDAIESLGKG